jgi:ankyrin repeat protein
MAGQVSNTPVQFYFRDYAALHWLDHVAALSWTDSKMLALLRSLSQRRVLDIFATDSAGQTLLSKVTNWEELNSSQRVTDVVNSVIKMIVDVRGIDGSIPYYDQEILMLVAIKNDDVSLVKKLVDAAQWILDTKHIHLDGRTSLSLAAEYGSTKIIDYMFRTGRVDFNSKDSEGWTPILYAVFNGQFEAAKLFCRASSAYDQPIHNLDRAVAFAADMSATDMIATDMSAAEILDELIAVSKYPCSIFYEGETRFFKAVKRKQYHVVNALVRMIDWSYFDPSCLLYAVQTDDEKMAKILLDSQKFDVNTRDTSGQTPLWYATRNGSDTIVRMLLERAADTHIRDPESGRTLLQEAAEKGDDVILTRLLMARGYGPKEAGELTAKAWGTGAADIDARDLNARDLLK